MKTKEYFDFQQQGLHEKTRKINRKKMNDPTSYLQTINIGFYIVTPILFGVFLGLTIDRMLKASPAFTILFLGLGTVASFYNLFRLTKK